MKLIAIDGIEINIISHNMLSDHNIQQFLKEKYLIYRESAESHRSYPMVVVGKK